MTPPRFGTTKHKWAKVRRERQVGLHFRMAVWVRCERCEKQGWESVMNKNQGDCNG